jgi:hypothetical protein
MAAEKNSRQPVECLCKTTHRTQPSDQSCAGLKPELRGIPAPVVVAQGGGAKKWLFTGRGCRSARCIAEGSGLKFDWRCDLRTIHRKGKMVTGSTELVPFSETNETVTASRFMPETE